MKKYTLRTVTQNEEVIAESLLELEENDTIILECPRDCPEEYARRWHDIVSQSLKKGNSTITLGLGITMKVLKLQ